MYGSPTLASASYTGLTGIGMQVQNWAKTGGGTISNDVGLMVGSQTAGTYNTDVLFGTTTAPNTTNYGLYQGDTYTNYLGGSLTVAGTATLSNGILLNTASNNYLYYVAGSVLHLSLNGTGDAMTIDASRNVVVSSGNLTVAGTSTLTGAVTQTAKTTTYNNIATAGNGVAAVVSAPRSGTVTNAVWTPAAYTTPAVDSSYEVSANINVTTSTTVTMTCTCTYTDETNTSRVLTLGFTNLAGATIVSSVTTALGNVPYEGLTYHIRCKASSTITFATAGTVTNVVYTAEANARQIN